MNFRQIIQDYFTFTRSERRGITVLLIVIFLLALANKVIFYFEKPEEFDIALLDSLKKEFSTKTFPTEIPASYKHLFRFNPNTIDQSGLDSLKIPEEVKRNILKFREKGGVFYTSDDLRKIYGVDEPLFNELNPFIEIENQAIPEKIENELFNFDPNLASDFDLKRLGLTARQIQTIRNYQSKGGHFRNMDDFFRIYGITPAQKAALSDHIVIASDQGNAEVKQLLPMSIRIELNEADSVELEKLPGIGDKLSKRIVKYRDLLGGFHHLSQLNEVYGLDPQLIIKLRTMIAIDTLKIRKVDLNFSETNDLAKHPYIGKSNATRIIRYRSRYGKINNHLILRDSSILKTAEYLRLKPYL